MAAPPVGPLQPTPIADFTRALAQQADQLLTCGSEHNAAAELIEGVLGPGGVLAQLTTLTEAASAWCARLVTAPADDLSDLLAEAARDLGEIDRRLSDTPARFIGLAWHRHEAERQQAATTRAAPAHGRTARMTPPAVLPGTGPKPGRTR
ncbi:hypothetical protein GCM10010430_70740 [Kitasatospora cystarginea]|uniref:Uncharacterized protein n=1 Tax=Kitasatospora cystarginea TaxID=58350 RepID=A0ABN3EWC0_9ACTN